MKTPIPFRHEVIDPQPPGAEHDITLVGDINGDGQNEIVIGGKIGPPNLFWYEHPSWMCHVLAADVPNLEAGGVFLDITGNGRPDIVAGEQWKGKNLYWFENPEVTTDPWPVRVITNKFIKYHDQAVGDVDGDGKPELVFLSQNAGVLGYFDVPGDPRIEPWPDSCCHILDDATGKTEGLFVGDVDGNGSVSIVAGTNIYRRDSSDWVKTPFAENYTMARVAVGDLNGDGINEIILCEGESEPGRLAIYSLEGECLAMLRDDLNHPHTLELADFDGSGSLDILVGEMGLTTEEPEIILYRNDGAGNFEPQMISRGIPIHQGKVGDLTGNGKPDIIGKPYTNQHVDVWFNLA